DNNIRLSRDHLGNLLADIIRCGRWSVDVERDVAALDPAQIAQPFDNCCEAGLIFRVFGGEGEEYRDAPHTLALLRSRRERPRRRAAEQRNEVAPFPLTEMHPIPSRAGSTSQDTGLQRISQRVCERFTTRGSLLERP